jgi:hypothetical protein
MYFVFGGNSIIVENAISGGGNRSKKTLTSEELKLLDDVLEELKKVDGDDNDDNKEDTQYKSNKTSKTADSININIYGPDREYKMSVKGGANTYGFSEDVFSDEVFSDNILDDIEDNDDENDDSDASDDNADNTDVLDDILDDFTESAIGGNETADNILEDADNAVDLGSGFKYISSVLTDF